MFEDGVKGYYGRGGEGSVDGCIHIRTFHFLRRFITFIKVFGNASLTFKFFNFIGKQFRIIFNCILKTRTVFRNYFLMAFILLTSNRAIS